MLKNKITIGLLFFLVMILSTAQLNAQKRYSGRRHTSSHGGHYSGGHGSSHRGGHYKHRSTSNHYGRHRR
ncbi:hypothetical protein [Flavobacterium sp. N1994]|uniref:hypothetical protein n=1 Tax=Flavobacterium sp. N1994 TaxID=2986827 RepID=UPI00222136D3|nr:hypothetical protein [Flavobacterium sp. N1994]